MEIGISQRIHQGHRDEWKKMKALVCKSHDFSIIVYFAKFQQIPIYSSPKNSDIN